MISELFVYAYLKGEQRLMGRLRQNSFRYASSWLSLPDSYPADPLRLPLVSGDFTERAPMSGMLSVFKDSLPDQWGMTVLNRKHDDLDQDDPLQTLLLTSNSDRSGALEFALQNGQFNSEPLRKRLGNTSITPPSSSPQFSN